MFAHAHVCSTQGRLRATGLAAITIAAGLAISGCGDKADAGIHGAGASSAPRSGLVTSYSGRPIAIPGIIEAENFDNGGEGSAYHDTTAGNATGQYRATDVDIDITSDVGGGYSVGWTEAPYQRYYSTTSRALPAGALEVTHGRNRRTDRHLQDRP